MPMIPFSLLEELNALLKSIGITTRCRNYVAGALARSVARFLD